MTINIRSLNKSNHLEWEPLWAGYLAFYKQDIPASVTEATWQRLLNPGMDIYGLCAVDMAGTMIGIVHFLYHPVTWSAEPRCYLEDLFVAENARGKGAGEALIEAVCKAADKRGSDQVYWLTGEDNHTARKLYDRVVHKTDSIKYIR